MKENIKVGFAAMFGLTSPNLFSIFFEHAEPVLKIALSLGQIGITIVTIFFIYRQWKNLKK